MIRFFKYIAVFAVSVAFGPVIAAETSVYDALVKLDVSGERDGEDFNSEGTGVVLSSDGLIVTAAHVVPKAFEGAISASFGRNATGAAIKLEVDGPCRNADCVFLRPVNSDPSRVFKPLRVRARSSLSDDEDITIYGYDEGSASATPIRGAVRTTRNDQSLFEFAAAGVNKGFSGGPVVLREESGPVLVGITTRAATATGTALMSDLVYARASKAVASTRACRMLKKRDAYSCTGDVLVDFRDQFPSSRRIKNPECVKLVQSTPGAFCGRWQSGKPPGQNSCTAYLGNLVEECVGCTAKITYGIVCSDS